jgi:hypothetical protein
MVVAPTRRQDSRKKIPIKALHVGTHLFCRNLSFFLLGGSAQVKLQSTSVSAAADLVPLLFKFPIRAASSCALRAPYGGRWAHPKRCALLHDLRRRDRRKTRLREALLRGISETACRHRDRSGCRVEAIPDRRRPSPRSPKPTLQCMFEPATNQ